MSAGLKNWWECLYVILVMNFYNLSGRNQTGKESLSAVGVNKIAILILYLE